MAKGAPIEIEDSSNGAQVLSSAPGSDSGQRALAVRVISSLTGGGGGGPATIADGADVAQGTTTDASGANTVIGKLKAIAASLAGTLTADVTDRAARLLGHVTVDNASIPVTGTFWQATQPVSGTVTADTELPAASALADTDGNPTTSRVGANGLLWNGTSWDRAPGDKTNGLKVQSGQLPAALAASGGLKVDLAGTGANATAVKVDGSAVTQPVSLATNTPDVTDRAARLLGVVDKGKVWDGTNIAAVKAASALAVATDPAFVVQHAPQRADASTLCVTATGAAAAAVTATLAAAGAGLFHYITSIQIVKFATALLTAAATPVLVTTTNLPGSPVFSFSAAASAQGTDEVQQITPATPLKSSVANTATTIVGPATTATIWRIIVTYYTAP